ncbi:Efflux RND transporter permease subunit [Candidatus Trichorickettsia mobilis]|uniref:Efflux RND transporter permease subunit n=1 Tax=Candidatus Trichorickettsia mobilis TaxID=1346319 RepID=A0ABZ0UUQ4_9RICK|nr:efflux RND transporter permease subunit [Candidatus Trichorickettsia mobilis]WPY00822.1 Efflux RND transporter permease subunit [Candidatus Trichorickettsia mobilis]
MSLSEICIKRPVFATVLSLVIITLGIIFFTKLQIRGMPDIDPPIITVIANYEGANALYMEQQVTTRIEKALKTVKDIDFISSQSSVGESIITLSFNLSADIEVALNDVRSKVSDISNLLPEDMKAPAVAKMDSDNFPSLWLSVNSDQYDQLELTKITEDRIRSVLERLPSVGRIVMHGAKYYTMRIEPDFVQMYQHQIAPSDIVDAVTKQNKDYPAGVIKTEVRDFIVKLNGRLSLAQEFENIILKSDNNNLLKLNNVAKVHLAPDENDTILRYNGSRSMAIGIVKQSKANEIELSNDVRTALQKISKNLPPSIKIEVAHDRAIPINASIKAVFITIFEALILVIIVVYLFLSSIRITLIPFVTIPVSLIGTFTVMHFFGFSINSFTLLAMVLAIGLVVDDAIVMLENIFRHYELGKSKIEAALSAAAEIRFAIIAMTITLAAVFLPVGFIDGFMGKLFIEFAWTLAFCVLFSGFVALTLTPMMASKMISDSHKSDSLPIWLTKFNYYLKYSQTKYSYYLNFALDHQKQLLMIIALSIATLTISLILVNKTFSPEEDNGFLQVMFTGSEGSNKKQAEQVVIQAEQIFKSYKDILGFFAVIWEGSSAFAFVPLKDWSIRSKSANELRQDLNKKLDRIPGMSIFAMNPNPMGRGGSGKQIEFNLQTLSEYDTIDQLSKKFIEKMKQNPLFENIERDFKSSTPTLDVMIDRDKAYFYGVSLDNIGSTIQYLIAGKPIGDFMIGNDVYDVILQYKLNDRNNVNHLEEILVKAKNNQMIPLAVVTQITEKITVKSYWHYNNAKSITISTDLTNKSNVKGAIKAINAIAEELLDNSDNTLEYLGEVKQMQESESNSIFTFLLALVFIYLVLAAQFESFFDPLLILVAVPFSITGGVLALLIAGDSINMYSNIGLITLIGLVTKNSIMIVEFTNQLRERGVQIRAAVLQAAELRLRPILMTSCATICGSIPLIFADGAGAAARNSIGLVIAGGMIIGTLFTIFVIPMLYYKFKKA